MLLEFATSKFLEAKPEQVEAELFELSAEVQVHACVMALVRARQKAPAPCRALATGYLFAAERPYFL